MARVKRAVHAKKKRRVILERAQGYYGNKSRSYKPPTSRSCTPAVRVPRPPGPQGRLPVALDPADQRRLPPERHQLQPVHRRPARSPRSRSTARSSPTSPCSEPAAFSALVEAATEALDEPRRARLGLTATLDGADPVGARHPSVQRLRRLSGRRSARLDEGAFVIDGPILLARGPRRRRARSTRSSPSRAARRELLDRAAAAGAAVRRGRPTACWPGSIDTVTPQAVAAIGPRVDGARRPLRPRPPPGRWRSCSSTWPTPATPARCCARPRPPAPRRCCSAAARSIPTTRSACGRRPGSLFHAAGGRATGDASRCWRRWRPRGRRHRGHRGRGGTPYDAVDLTRPGGARARQRGPRPARRGGRRVDAGRHHPDGRALRVAQRGHGGLGPVLRVAPPAPRAATAPRPGQSTGRRRRPSGRVHAT